MEQKKIKDLANNEFSNVRIAVDFHDYEIGKDPRRLSHSRTINIMA